MGSREQTKLKDSIHNIFKCNVIQDWRPDHLSNPRTGHNLEIDLYFTDFNIGLEYQGRPHFKDVSDKSRLHDIIKSDLVLNHGKSFGLIEVFYSDLNGDFKNNFINRIINTQAFYISKFKPTKAERLEQLRIAVLLNHENKLRSKIIVLKDKKTGEFIDVCYKSVRYLHALRTSLDLSIMKINGLERAMGYMKNLTLCRAKCICNNWNLNIDLETYFTNYREYYYNNI